MHDTECEYEWRIVFQPMAVSMMQSEVSYEYDKMCVDIEHEYEWWIDSYSYVV